jgi:flagellar biosynthesis/type III secretory pathway ATPase
LGGSVWCTPSIEHVVRREDPVGSTITDSSLDEPVRNESAEAPDPMKRRVIKDPLPLGVRAIDSLLTCGEGQRMGIFAAAGGGKSTLLGMLSLPFALGILQNLRF